MKHTFDVKFAEKYGMAEAVLAENLFFWVKKNAANETNFHDGKYWTFNSRKAFNRLFPYIKEKSIERALSHLAEEGIIVKGNFNEDKFDKTMWYAFTPKGESEMSEIVDFTDTDKLSTSTGQIDQSIGQNDPPIPYINNTDITLKENLNPYGLSQKKGRTAPSYESILDESGIDESVRETVYEFIKMRKLIKSPMTDKALSLMIAKLKKMDRSPEGQIEILNQSITNSWKGLFPVKQTAEEQKQAKEAEDLDKYARWEKEANDRKRL